MRKTQRKQCVLVVDDQPNVLKFIRIDLTLRGFEVLATTSGQDALALVKSGQPDVILLDIIMPGIDGFELLKRLRAFSNIPVIVFSAGSGNAEKAIRAGANDFTAKPFRVEELVRKIELLLDHKKSE